MIKKTNLQDDLALFNNIVNQLLIDEEQNPVNKPIPTSVLENNVDLTLNDDPMMDSEFNDSINNLVLKTPKTASPLFFNQLFGGRNSKAILGDLLAVMLNNSMYTYKVAGPQVGIEKTILNKIGELINYPADCDGTFAPGGSMSNFMAMVMARDAKNLDVRFKGVTSTYTLYTSKQSHYSIPKNAAFIGIGRDQVRLVATDNMGKIDVVDLEEKIKADIEQGFTPFFVNATAGTTVLGAFDPVEKISAICKKYSLWLHVDGAYCGSVIFSDKYKHLVKGIEKSDSFSVNAHKMLGTPLTCSVFITPHKKSLNDSFSNDAGYLYQTDDDDFNLGKTSIQCGRRNDALKFWTLWKAVGTKGLEKIVDHQFDLADIARNHIKANSDYTLYSFDDSISICFNYKNIPAEKLCTLLYEKAQLVVGFGNVNNQEFIRLVTVNAQNTTQDILHFFEVLEKFVSENEALLLEPNKEMS
jgi:sulfinoalanine decarboxylase/sulfinoalanine decarboxylase/aspartate 1-decarboxylase